MFISDRYRNAIVLAASILIVGCGGEHMTLVDGSVPDAHSSVDGGPSPLVRKGLVMSALEIGRLEDGFDLDESGDPDNALSALSTLFAQPTTDALNRMELLNVLEVPGFVALEPGAVSVAFSVGTYPVDFDGDGAKRSGSSGDCNDLVASIHPGATEDPANGIDDNCDGVADEGNPNNRDDDLDGISVADGDCDDTRSEISPLLDDACGDGLDNNCDGVADYDVAASEPRCSPYDDVVDAVALEGEFLDAVGAPLHYLADGSVDDSLVLQASSGEALIRLPTTDSPFDLIISEARIAGTLVERTDGFAVSEGRLGGVLSAPELEHVTGVTIPDLGLTADRSLLDALFAGVAGVLIGLPKIVGGPWDGCITADIDVDGDGLEGFCDSDPFDSSDIVDVCIDGDGTAFFDGDVPCTELLDLFDEPRFPDGVSVEFNFNAVPATLLIP